MNKETGFIDGKCIPRIPALERTMDIKSMFIHSRYRILQAYTVCALAPPPPFPKLIVQKSMESSLPFGRPRIQYVKKSAKALSQCSYSYNTQDYCFRMSLRAMLAWIRV
jgi:hypothetical protein